MLTKSKTNATSGTILFACIWMLLPGWILMLFLQPYTFIIFHGCLFWFAHFLISKDTHEVNAE